ncbi:MAG: T9SS type A sorting domain-containing protein [Bacteroides sp.]|nr:T9SS type A sorting domain-containing protein [Roseburia sp.]MCM1347262.1 T9SS type A sorting domain-containing protein [Bacteroides sp.]MCM1421686.1 T9SS type A sorting domain-containing protein [Bacteroides sp.]
MAVRLNLHIPTWRNGLFKLAENGILSVNGDFSILLLYNLSGNKVIETSESQVSASILTPGIYIAQACNGNRSVTRKINVR